jgi:subtilisin family serine protease
MDKILDNNYYDLVINNALIPQFRSDDNITWLNHDFSLLHVSKSDKQLCDLGLYPYYLFPALFTPTSIISNVPDTMCNTQQTKNYTLYGQGVLVGIVDTGIDYQHPAFMNRDKTTRIISMWDQTQQDGIHPESFNFGAEYTKALINSALHSTDPMAIVPSKDRNGHGTAIASIAAGSPTEDRSFTGLVPNSELVVVKLKEAKQNLKMIFCVPDDKLCYQESDIVLGIRYLISVAQRLKRPLVICIALGSSQGSHDGRGVLSLYLESIIRIPDISVAISAGNEGNSNRHYHGTSNYSPYTKDFQLNVGSADRMFSMEIWPNLPGRLAVEITSPNREIISLIQPSFSACEQFKFQSSSSVVWINNMAFERGTGDQLIMVRFKDPLPGIWYFHVQSTDNEPFSIHSWLPSGNLISNNTFFLLPNPDTTITAPGNTWHTLTVTAYNQTTGNILNESGRGYTRSGLVKPDVAAPGYQVSCALPGGTYGTLTGTGAAAAYATGSLAMIFEWTQGKGNYTYVTGEQASLMLIRTANRNPAYSYPNNIWGYGTIDVGKVITRISGDV